MRILIHTNQLLYPGDGGGKIRSAALFEALAREHEVTVAVFRRPSDDAGAVERMQRCAARVVAIDLDEPAPPSLRFHLGLARAGASSLPFSARKVQHAGMQRAIRELVAHRRPDLIVCDFVQSAINLPLDAVPAVPAVLSTHNVEATIVERLADHEPGLLARAYLQLEAAKLRRWEAATARRFDRVVVVSEDDRDSFARRYQVGGAVVAPNGVDLERFRSTRESPAGRDVVFVGCLDWSPNADAVTHYVDHVLPRLRRRGASRFWIVGRNPPAAVRALADRNRDVTVTGTVPDVRPYLERAAVVVVPLRIGGGTRIKILEAMAMTRPVVATTIGAEGLDVEDGRHLMRADDPADFADRVATLLDAPALQARLGREGRRLVEARYSWAASARIFTAACEDAVSPRSGAARVAVRR
jgi:sugar transferase (PEP-CTERM/EpsH1 system associated)